MSWDSEHQEHSREQYAVPPQVSETAHIMPSAQALPQPQALPMMVAPKNPGIALIVSFFIPGLGSMINGRVGIGATILLVYIAGAVLSVVLIGIPIAIGAWMWGMLDGYKSAQNWNRAHGILS